MGTRTDLVLLVAGLAVIYGSCVGVRKMMCAERYHASLVPQRIVEINEEIPGLGRTRIMDVNVLDLGQRASCYESLISERSEIYASDPNIEVGVNYEVSDCKAVGLLFSFGLGSIFAVGSAYEFLKDGVGSIRNRKK